MVVVVESFTRIDLTHKVTIILCLSRPRAAEAYSVIINFRGRGVDMAQMENN